MEIDVTLSGRARDPEAHASTVEVTRLEITAFNSQRNRDFGVTP